jgi:putative transposase
VGWLGLQFDREIRTVICTTNAIVNQRTPQASRERPRSFPDRARGTHVPVPGDHEPRPTGKGRKRWTNRWKAALNAFDITFDGRLSAGRN